MEERDKKGFPERGGDEVGDRSRDREPHHALNNPVGEPHPRDDPEAEPVEAPERDTLDD
jgi:hypothetical protein